MIRQAPSPPLANPSMKKGKIPNSNCSLMKLELIKAKAVLWCS